jgi:hypothetical protein
MPSEGFLDTWVAAESDDATHLLSVYDEWGNSRAFAWQQNYLAIKVDSALRPGRWQKVLTFWYKFSGDTDFVRVNNYIGPGAKRWAHFVSENFFPKGTWVHAAVGTVSWQRAYSNDKKVISGLRFTWRIKAVGVEPGG